MGYQATTFQLPCGARALRLELSGVFSGAEAAELSKHSDPGGQFQGLPCLILTQKMESLSAEAREVFAGRGERPEPTAWTAMVVTSPIIRVVANFMMRIQRYKRTKMFTSEEEGLRWLDARAGPTGV
ncbi:MAG TPA: hypothetical protein VND93_19535 [Myxococcales bacterium]|jgi:hypothetical protein|nr:hypothetical protein [Myxococcales bacterium]